MDFDLPKDKEAFLQHPDWDFSLSDYGDAFQVSMEEIDGLPENQELAYLKATVLRVLEKKTEVIGRATDQFLDEYNQKWNEGAPVTRDDFSAQLKIGGIYIEDAGRLAVELVEGRDMFRGHAITITFGPEMQIVEVGLAG
jgi:hypothetical protein